MMRSRTLFVAERDRHGGKRQVGIAERA